MSRHWSWMLLLAAACGAPREIIPTGAANAGPAVAAEVTIHAGETQPTTLSWGLVHGLTRNQIGSANPTPLLRALQPKVWRMSNALSRCGERDPRALPSSKDRRAVVRPLQR